MFYQSGQNHLQRNAVKRIFGFFSVICRPINYRWFHYQAIIISYISERTVLKLYPVVGDQKYGKGKETCKRLALHAKSISFIHPISGKRLTFETGFPEYFNKLVECKEQRWGMTRK
jgi:hypothetical protein